MKTIHKIAAMVIENDEFLMVRKRGKDIYTSLGGKPEGDETEEQALVREIREEANCEATVVRKLGDFEAKAIFDDAMVRLSVYLVVLHGRPRVTGGDEEVEEIRFLPKNYKELGLKVPSSIEDQILPYCMKEGLLHW